MGPEKNNPTIKPVDLKVGPYVYPRRPLAAYPFPTPNTKY